MVGRREVEEQAKELLWGDIDGDPLQNKSDDDSIQNRLNSMFFYAGMNGAEIRKLYLNVIIAVTVVSLILIFIHRLVLIPLFIFGILLIARIKIARKTWLRTEDFERDYVPLLISVASGIRTGLDPLIALQECGSLFSEGSILRKELNIFSERLERGEEEDHAVWSFAASIKHPDLKLFKSTFILARKEGSSLGASLQRLAKVTRQRQSFRRKIKSALAMQRLSAVGIAGCAIIIGLIQVAGNADLISDALKHPVGFWALTGGVSLMLLGLGWMFYMSRRRL